MAKEITLTADTPKWLQDPECGPHFYRCTPGKKYKFYSPDSSEFVTAEYLGQALFWIPYNGQK